MPNFERFSQRNILSDAEKCHVSAKLRNELRYYGIIANYKLSIRYKDSRSEIPCLASFTINSRRLATTFYCPEQVQIPWFWNCCANAPARCDPFKTWSKSMFDKPLRHYTRQYFKYFDAFFDNKACQREGVKTKIPKQIGRRTEIMRYLFILNDIKPLPGSLNVSEWITLLSSLNKICQIRKKFSDEIVYSEHKLLFTTSYTPVFKITPTEKAKALYSLDEFAINTPKSKSEILKYEAWTKCTERFKREWPMEEYDLLCAINVNKQSPVM
tara:strand:+ start:642 stop:1451 length:810 start_codon:yes stop_codon:yes gene_type:complete